MVFSDFEKGKCYRLCDIAGREFINVCPAQFDPENAWELLILDPWESWAGFGPFYDVEELAAKLADFVENDHPHPGCRVAVKFMDWEEATIRITR